jgi:hypothetical protein
LRITDCAERKNKSADDHQADKSFHKSHPWDFCVYMPGELNLPRKFIQAGNAAVTQKAAKFTLHISISAYDWR